MNRSTRHGPGPRNDAAGAGKASPATGIGADLPLGPEEAAEAATFVGVALGKASDEELMRRTQEGDRQAYAVLYERYSGAVLSYLYRLLGNIEDVEAVGQEVFLRAFRFASTYKYPQKFATWLYTITRNLAINQSRRRRRNPVKGGGETDLLEVQTSADPRRVAESATESVEKREQIERVLVALDDLPVDQREVIVMGVFQDLSYAQMEQITGTKAVTLRSRMFHGLRRLGSALGSPPAGKGGKTP